MIFSAKYPADNARLAVALRQAQWDMDDVAFNLPEGRVTPVEREKLADALVRLAEQLRGW
ncbi:hypothetical protein GCM10009854_16380 [Saccharopolyspora halophila]|uniref:Uncharacterized protein n=1 Tax=Saccharopolyspora halophila TaxID=405551 RepID=A0ABP5SZZ9_9PSEU